MMLRLKLSRSRSSSPASSTPSSPIGTPQASPAASQKKPRFALPGFISSSKKKMSKQDAAAAGISTPSPRASSSSSPQLPTPSTRASSSSSPQLQLAREKGKSVRTSECSSGMSSPARMAPLAAHEWRLELEQVFAQFDANGDGRISTEELQAVLASLGEKATMEEAALMLMEMDMDGDGFIDLEEFVEMNRLCTEECTLEEEMEAAFAIFDSEKTGRITAEGLQQVLLRLGGSMAQRSSVEDCRRMIRGVDRKGVGHVDLEDFKRLMNPLIF